MEEYQSVLLLILHYAEVISVLEKKKRRSESVSGSSSDKISVNDDEDKTRGIQTFSAEALLEQVFHVVLLLLYMKNHIFCFFAFVFE